MNYYKQGDAANADKIRAAFEKLGFDVGTNSCAKKGLYFTFDGKVCYTDDYVYPRDMMLETFIKKDHDYQELELPKPHYDIANFHAGMPVLVRETSLNAWQYVLFSHCYMGGDGLTRFNAGLVGFTQCIPFNEETKHLLGTTKPCGEEYINW